MKPLRAFAAGMLVGALATFGVCLALQPGHPAAVRSGLATLAAAAREAAGRLVAAVDFAPSPRFWTLRRPVDGRLRMRRTGVVLTHRILPETPLAASNRQIPFPGHSDLSVNSSTSPEAVAPVPPSIEPSAQSALSAGPDMPAAASPDQPGAAAVPAVVASAPAAPEPREPSPKAAATGAPAQSPDRAYARALQAYEAGRQEEARGLFAAFLDDFPGHELAPNAVYWTGEAWYDQARYDKAAEAFARVLREYPRHPKSPDALLKLAYTAMRQGRPDAARQYLDQLQARYPGSGASRLGRQARGRLQGRNSSGTMVATHG